MYCQLAGAVQGHPTSSSSSDCHGRPGALVDMSSDEELTSYGVPYKYLTIPCRTRWSIRCRCVVCRGPVVHRAVSAVSQPEANDVRRTSSPPCLLGAVPMPADVLLARGRLEATRGRTAVKQEQQRAKMWRPLAGRFLRPRPEGESGMASISVLVGGRQGRSIISYPGPFPSGWQAEPGSNEHRTRVYNKSIFRACSCGRDSPAEHASSATACFLDLLVSLDCAARRRP